MRGWSLEQNWTAWKVVFSSCTDHVPPPASSMTTDSTSPRPSRSRPDLASTIARVTRHHRSDGAIAAILSRSASFRAAGQWNASVP